MSNLRVGKLKFKEGTGKAAHVPKKVKKTEKEEGNEPEDIVTEDKVINYEAKDGEGTITTSGRTVHGNDTKFR